MKHLKRFNESDENLNISDGTIELIGPNIDEILDAINFINDNYEGVKIKPTDFQKDSDKPYSHKRNYNYAIFVKLEPIGDEGKHIRFMNDLLDKKKFKCRLYAI
jgi:hypothetical protein